MTIQMPPTVATYIQAINNHDAAAFIPLFADGAAVDDAGKEYRGLAEIQAWSDREIFAARVTLEVNHVFKRDGETVVTTKVEGNFDRTGLPDPVIINHHFMVERDKIVRLICRLADGVSGAQ